MRKGKVADAYLNIAEQVILASRRPLRPLEIINYAYAEQLLPWHLHGLTQNKTLHARIAEDIASNAEDSRFFRTAPGVFFLKHLLTDPQVPEAFKHPYFALPRRKELRRERILTLDRLYALNKKASHSFIDIDSINREFVEGCYRYITHQELLHREGSVAVHSFVLVFNRDRVLSYRCGKFSPRTDPLYGMRSIGVGGAVYVSDRDLLFSDMFGVVSSGINELSCGIGLSRRLSERARYNNEVRPCLGVLLPGTADRPPVIHVVLAYECPEEFFPSKAALSVNDLSWINIHDTSNSYDGFDQTSRLLFTTKRVLKIRSMVG